MEDQENGGTPWFIVGCPLAAVALLTVLILVVVVGASIMLGLAAAA
jgi:hypothetical protein